jgi:histidine triad (HIT) family protein
MSLNENCIFCKIIAGQIPSIKIYEDQICLAFMDISPLNEGHLLVVPKDHCETILEISPEEYGHLYQTACKLAAIVKNTLNPDGINIMQLNGKAANQVVPHLHVHLVPRWNGDGLTISAWEPIMGDKSQINSVAEKIKSNL